MKVHEHHHRTLFKSITWFIVGFLIAFGVLYFVTGDFRRAAIDAVFIQILKFAFFYLHERVWNKFSVGQRIKENGVLRKL